MSASLASASPAFAGFGVVLAAAMAAGLAAPAAAQNVQTPLQTPGQAIGQPQPAPAPTPANGMTGYPLSATAGAPAGAANQQVLPDQATLAAPAPETDNPQVNALSAPSTASPLGVQSGAQYTTEYETGQSAFARDRNVSVADRPHPEYQPYLVYLGDFILKPQFDTRLEYSDNIFATQTDKVSDFDLALKPTLAIASNWTHDSLSGFLSPSYDSYFDHPRESQPQVDLGGQYRKDLLTNSYLAIAAEYGDRVEPRSASTGYLDARSPLRYDYGNLDLKGVYEANRYRFTAEGYSEDYSYHDQTDATGTPLFLQVNNHLTSTGSFKAEYAYNPGVALYATASVNDHLYPNTPPGLANRDSSGYVVALGTNFDLTHLMRGDIQFGYLDQTYRASGVSVASGLSMQGKLEYFPTQLTTITFTGTRAIEDTDSPNSPSSLTTGGDAKVDHELYRNIILSAYGSYYSDTYQGAQRTDTRWTLSAQAVYLMNRHMAWTLAYRRNNLDSSGLDRVQSFQENAVLLTLGLRY